MKQIDFKSSAKMLFTIALVALPIILALVVFNFRSLQNTLPTTSSFLRADSHKIRLRLPRESEHFREDISVLIDPNANNTWRVVRGPSDPSQPGVNLSDYTRTPMTIELQQGVIDLQNDWCTIEPKLTPVREVDLFYDLAINCPSRNTVRQFNILPEELPQVLIDLIDFTNP